MKSGLFTTNPTLLGVPAVIITQVELGYSVVSATIPCLNPFMRALSTNYGAMDRDTVMLGSQLQDTRKDSNYGLRSMESAKTQAAKRGSILNASARRDTSAPESPPPAGIDSRIYRGDQASSIARAFSERHLDSESVGSNDSTKMIIKKEVQWVVESDSDQTIAPK
jgi:hypothetical protein